MVPGEYKKCSAVIETLWYVQVCIYFYVSKWQFYKIKPIPHYLENKNSLSIVYLFTMFLKLLFYYKTALITKHVLHVIIFHMINFDVKFSTYNMY